MVRGVNGLCSPSTVMVNFGNRTSRGYARIGNANFGCPVCRGVSSDVEPPGCNFEVQGARVKRVGRLSWA